MNAWLLLPVLAHVALVFIIGARTGYARRAAVLRGEVKLRDIALDARNWPDDLRKLANAFDNQFQMPLAFYACVAFTIMFGKAGAVAVVLAWLFVAARYVHAFIHVTSNHVPTRFAAFMAGVACLLLLWLHLAIRVYVVG